MPQKVQTYHIPLKYNNTISRQTQKRGNATYTSLNEFTDKKQDYQFELCEKPVIKLPEKYNNKSVVIMDGPFMCIDPLGETIAYVWKERKQNI